MDLSLVRVIERDHAVENFVNVKSRWNERINQASINVYIDSSCVADFVNGL